MEFGSTTDLRFIPSDIQSVDYFSENALLLFMIAETSGGNRHTLNFELDNNILNANYELVQTGSSTDMVFWYVTVTMPKGFFDNIEKVFRRLYN